MHAHLAALITVQIQILVVKWYAVEIAISLIMIKNDVKGVFLGALILSLGFDFSQIKNLFKLNVLIRLG